MNTKYIICTDLSERGFLNAYAFFFLNMDVLIVKNVSTCLTFKNLKHDFRKIKKCVKPFILLYQKKTVRNIFDILFSCSYKHYILWRLPTF